MLPFTVLSLTSRRAPASETLPFTVPSRCSPAMPVELTLPFTDETSREASGGSTTEQRTSIWYPRSSRSPCTCQERPLCDTCIPGSSA